MRNYGYQTAFVGKAHLIRKWLDEGFERYTVCDMVDAWAGGPESCHYFKYLKDHGLADYYEEGNPKPGQEYTLDGSAPAAEHFNMYNPNDLTLPASAVDLFDRKFAGKPSFMQAHIQQLGGYPYVSETDCAGDRRINAALRYDPGKLMQQHGIYWSDLEHAYHTKKPWPPEKV